MGKFYTLLQNTDPDLSYFNLSYVFLGHNDSVERGPTVVSISNYLNNWEGMTIFGRNDNIWKEWQKSGKNDSKNSKKKEFQSVETFTVLTV